MSLDNSTKQRRELDFLEGNENNLSNFNNFDNIDLHLEETENDHYDADNIQNFKINGLQSYRSQQPFNSHSSHQGQLPSSNQVSKYTDFINQQQGTNATNNQGFMFPSNCYENNNEKQIIKQNSNGSNKNGQGRQSYSNFQSLNSGDSYQSYSQEQLGGKGQNIISPNCLSSNTQAAGQKQPQKAGGSPIDIEQQKQMKLINALKSNPQDLEHILEEQEKQQTIQKQLKIEVEQKNNLQRHSSSIQLTNYSPTRETLKRVESNTSLNGEKQSQKNLSKIKGNVKNAYIKKITSLLNLQNAPVPDQQDNFQEPRRPDNSDDSDDSEQKSYDNTKQEDGKKVMKNRESARNSRQRKKIYIELLEKKISDLTQQIEEQCVNIEKSQKEICKILDNHNHIKAFVQTRHDYVQKIGEMSYAEKPNNEQLSYILDSLRLRIGAQGTCRQKAISLYFRTIMKHFMQSTYPYLIYGFQQNISEDQEFNRCVEIFKKICNIQDEAHVFKFLPHLKKFLECRMNFKESYQKVKKIRKSVFKREESIEKLLDGLSLLYPTQMGKFLKGLDKFRKYREIRLQRKPDSETADHSEIDTQVFGKQIQLPGRQINKLRQQTVQNQYMNNNNNNYQQIYQQQSIYQPLMHPMHNIEQNEESELGQQPKQMGIPQNYYMNKQVQNIYNPIQQQNIKQEIPQTNQKYIQQHQNTLINGQHINVNKQGKEYDQFYHQQPYKKQFYSNTDFTPY